MERGCQHNIITAPDYPRHLATSELLPADVAVDVGCSCKTHSRCHSDHLHLALVALVWGSRVWQNVCFESLDGLTQRAPALWAPLSLSLSL